MLHDSGINASNTIKVSQCMTREARLQSESPHMDTYWTISLNVSIGTGDWQKWRWARNEMTLSDSCKTDNLSLLCIAFQLPQWTKTTIPIDARINVSRSHRASTVGTTFDRIGSTCRYHFEGYTRLHQQEYSRWRCDHIRKCNFRLDTFTLNWRNGEIEFGAS